MKAAVTGATGLVGTHIVRALLDKGHVVRCVVRPTSRRGTLDGLPVQFFLADLPHQVEELEAACAGCDVVFHTAVDFAYAGIDPADLHDTAVLGTAALLRACARQNVSRIVITSSSVVFGYSSDGTIRHENAFLAGDRREPPYVAAKIAQHRRSMALAKELRLDLRLACPTMTIGPAASRLGPSNGAIVAYLTDPLACTFPGGCNLVSARDVALGHLLIAERGRAGESYLLGSQNLTWRQVHALVAELTGVAPPRVELSHAMAFVAAAAEEFRAAIAGRPPLATREQASMIGRYYWYSHAKAAELGYSPCPAHDALVEAISWLAASPHVPREIRTRMRLAADIYRYRSTICGSLH